MQIKEVIKGYTLEGKSLKKIIDELWMQKQKELGLEHVRLYYSLNPFSPNGSVAFNGDIDKIKIKFNLRKYKNKKDSNTKRLFCAYVNLLHEIEHAKTFVKTQKEDFYDYEHLLVLLEFLAYLNILQIDVKRIKSSLLKTIMMNVILKTNYLISTSEIKSNLVSYREALIEFSEFLNEDDIETHKKLVDMYELLNENIEIVKTSNAQYIDKLRFIVLNSFKIISKNPEIIQKFKILTHLFNEDGTHKNIYELYQNINVENKEMYDKLIMSMFTLEKIDLHEYFQSDEGFKKYIEDLVARYRNKNIGFYNNIQKIDTFFDSPLISRNNLINQKQTELILRKLSEEYGLESKSGFVLDYRLQYIENVKRL